MRRAIIRIALFCGLAAVVIFAVAQGTRKPGLWEMTTEMTWQQSPMPPNMSAPPAPPFGSGKHVFQVCLTQAMIDRYGAPVPQSHGGCQISNAVKETNSMTADWVCTGMMSGKGTVESHWSDDEHATGKIHFVGTMQMGPNPVPVEWTTESTSVYKGADCGSVQPMPMPEK
jgi:Protein of unknown function (DUF3617)